jgi:hypothetical protein
MQASTTFEFTAPNDAIRIPNGTQASSSASCVVSYVLNGTPSAVSISVEGITASQGGAATVLDVFTGTTNSGPRSISLSSTYDSFKIVGTWTAPEGFSVTGTFALSGGAGAGASFNSEIDLPNIATH